MSKVAIVTDSTTCIPKEVTGGLPVYTIPMHLIWNQRTYRDNVDITPEQFYERLKNEKDLPTTSQAPPEEFAQFYMPLLEKGYDILSVHISARLSNILNSALLAVDTLKTNHIEVFDSQTASIATWFQVLAAARASSQGATLQECKNLAEKVRRQTCLYLIPESLEYLRRGGRIGSAAAFLGSMLHIVPILETRNGIVESVERVRTVNRAIDRTIELVAARMEGHPSLRLVIGHTNSQQKAGEFFEKARRRLGAERICESFITGISPTMGTHIGPGGVGIACTLDS